jgi:hypothetical protein
MILRVAASTEDQSWLTKALVAAAQGAVQVRPRVVFEDASAIYDPGVEAKATRLVDRR